MNYREYLQTEEWKRKSEKTKRLAGNRCQVCNSPKNLNTHHRTYERLGNELQSDLICLCHDCHEKFHEKGRYQKDTIENDLILMERLAPRLNIVSAIKSIFSPAISPAIDYFPSDNPKIITIVIRKTGDSVRDDRRLRNVQFILQAKPGNDRFEFIIDGKLMEFPNDTTHITIELLNRLQNLLGEQSWTVKDIL